MSLNVLVITRSCCDVLMLVRVDGRPEMPAHTMKQAANEPQASASSNDVAQTPAIKLRIKIGRETVVGTKRFADSLTACFL